MILAMSGSAPPARLPFPARLYRCRSHSVPQLDIPRSRFGTGWEDRMPHRIFAGMFAALFLVSSGLNLAYGQITNVANDTITPIEGVGHDYIKMMSETVNPANGGLNIHIDLPVA